MPLSPTIIHLCFCPSHIFRGRLHENELYYFFVWGVNGWTCVYEVSSSPLKRDIPGFWCSHTRTLRGRKPSVLLPGITTSDVFRDQKGNVNSRSKCEKQTRVITMADWRELAWCKADSCGLASASCCHVGTRAQYNQIFQIFKRS